MLNSFSEGVNEHCRAILKGDG